ncbi:MAG: hypothetical protein WAR39_08085 [Prevotella sp.]
MFDFLQKNGDDVSAIQSKNAKGCPAGYWLLVGDVEIIINLPQKFSTFPSITVWG